MSSGVDLHSLEKAQPDSNGTSTTEVKKKDAEILDKGATPHSQMWSDYDNPVE